MPAAPGSLRAARASPPATQRAHGTHPERRLHPSACSAREDSEGGTTNTCRRARQERDPPLPLVAAGKGPHQRHVRHLNMPSEAGQEEGARERRRGAAPCPSIQPQRSARGRRSPATGRRGRRSCPPAARPPCPHRRPHEAPPVACRARCVTSRTPQPDGEDAGVGRRRGRPPTQRGAQEVARGYHPRARRSTRAGSRRPASCRRQGPVCRRWRASQRRHSAPAEAAHIMPSPMAAVIAPSRGRAPTAPPPR